jgi:hypothetical protein
VYLALDVQTIESRWLLGQAARQRFEADALVLRFDSSGRWGSRHVSFTLRALAALEAGAPVIKPATVSCDRELELAPIISKRPLLSRNVAPRSDGETVRLHANPPKSPLAEIFHPVRPCADTCVLAELGVEPSAEKDAVTFELHVIDREVRSLLFRREVSSDEPAQHVELPLWQWANSDVLLRFGSERTHGRVGRGFLRRPRLGSCTSRTNLARAVGDARASVTAGKARPSGDDLELSGACTRIYYPLNVTKDTCLTASAEVQGDNDARFLFEAYVLADDVEHQLFAQRVRGRDGAVTLAPISLHDWHERNVALVLASKAEVAPNGERAWLRKPLLARCPGG